MLARRITIRRYVRGAAYIGNNGHGIIPLEWVARSLVTKLARYGRTMSSELTYSSVGGTSGHPVIRAIKIIHPGVTVLKIDPSSVSHLPSSYILFNDPSSQPHVSTYVLVTKYGFPIYSRKRVSSLFSIT